MNLISLMPKSADFLAYVAEPALRALIVAGVTALVAVATPGKRAVVRLYIWTGVLYVALAMPLLGALLPQIRLVIPASVWHLAAPVTPPAPETEPVAAAALPASTPALSNPQQRSTPEPSPRPSAVARPETSEASQPIPVRILTRVDWKTTAVGIYFVGLLSLLARLLLGVLGSRRLAASAEVISARYFLRKDETGNTCTSAALDLLSLHSRLAGLKSPPRLKECVALSVPATVGVRQPVILLPPGWRTWTQSKLNAVLAHEVSHVVRRDAVTQLLSLLHRAIFWFSPLAWWLERQLTELAEQASDEAALAGGADRTLYAETLLGFLAQLESGPGRIRWQALCMANRDGSGRAERRIDRILTWKRASSTKKSFTIGLIALAVPLVFVAASVRPFIAQGQSRTTFQPSASLPPAAAATALPATLSATLLSENASPTPPFRGAEETATNAEKQAGQDEKQSGAGKEDESFFDGYGPRYVIMTANSKSVSMSGNNEDLQHALALHKKINGDFVWFERDEKSYIITDRTFIAQALSLFAPQEELGKKQEELGRQQEELGRQQEALGGRMESTTVKVPDLAPELERIHARLKELGASGATQEELSRLQGQLAELQSRLGRLQADAGQQQSVFGRQQGELGRKQGELGRQQGELGRQQADLARKASRKLRSMFDDAIARGIAKPE